MFWAAAKIFRVGILSYGKRPTIPELWCWMKVASAARTLGAGT